MVGVDDELGFLDTEDTDVEVLVMVTHIEEALVILWTLCIIPVVFVLVSWSRMRDSLRSILLTDSLSDEIGSDKPV